MNAKQRSETQESLLRLYLRLNGYFVTGHIVHSAKQGKNKTEIDALAVRHAHNAEPDREIGPSQFLSPKGTDLLICEVKSGDNPTFNPALGEIALQKVLQWAGLFDGQEVAGLADALMPLLAANAHRHLAAQGVVRPSGVTVRALLCAPETEAFDENQPWILGGTEIFTYVGKCLRPETVRPGCSTTYNYECWGELTPIVRYFKKRPPEDPGRIQDLYGYLEAPKEEVHIEGEIIG
jgi:hypothetical protein